MTSKNQDGMGMGSIYHATKYVQQMNNLIAQYQRNENSLPFPVNATLWTISEFREKLKKSNKNIEPLFMNMNKLEEKLNQLRQ